jgi:WD40 repeat protein
VILFAIAALLAAPDVVLQSGHGANISALAFSPDGKYVVTASEDSTLKLWDPNTGAEVRTLRGHSNIVTAVAMSGDGTKIASASLDHTLRVWDAATGGVLASFKGPTPSVYLLKITPDSESLITAETVAIGTVLRVWDIKTVQQTRVIKRPDAAVSQVFFSGSTLLVAEESGEDDPTGALVSFNLQTGRQVQTRRLLLCGASNDGRWIAIDQSTDKARKALLVDLPRDKPVAVLTGQISRVMFSSNGDWLAYESLAGDTAIVRRTNGGQAYTIHGRGPEFSMLALSPDGHWLASAGADFAIHIWDVQSGKLAQATSGQYTPSAIAFSPDGKRVAVNGGGTDLGSGVRVWDLSRRSQVAGPKVKHAVAGLAYSRDGAYLAVSSPSLEMFDTRTNESVAKFDCGSAAALSPAFSPNGRWIAANCGGVVNVWPVPGGSDGFHLGEASEANNGPLLFSPDGKLLAVGTATGVSVYDLATRRIAQSLKTGNPVSALAFSPAGDSLVIGLHLKDEKPKDEKLPDQKPLPSVLMVDLHSRRTLWNSAPGQWVSAAKFLPGGRGLLVASGSLTLFDPATGKEIRTVRAKVPSNAGTFSPDADWFAAGWNSAANLWRIR